MLVVLNFTLKEYMKAKYFHVQIVTTKQVLKHSLIITSKKYMKLWNYETMKSLETPPVPVLLRTLHCSIEDMLYQQTPCTFFEIQAASEDALSFQQKTHA